MALQPAVPMSKPISDLLLLRIGDQTMSAKVSYMWAQSCPSYQIADPKQ